ncbi:MAG: hypothetical protein ABJN03_19605 [Ascidiaceihabitans sp.]|uniref:hypothetical protein n=1 Tax=Ascidiaceihabitans sp. TaxID=1872644 RepID=UPI0032975724
MPTDKPTKCFRSHRLYKPLGAQDLAIARRDLTQEREHIRADPDLDPTARRLRLNELDVAIRVNGLDLAEAFPGYNDIIAPVPLTVAQVQALKLGSPKSTQSISAASRCSSGVNFFLGLLS